MMNFYSHQFILFFLLSVSIYFILPHRVRWIFLLASSYFFYACWKVEYLMLLLFSTFVNYISGGPIEKSTNPTLRKIFLLLSLFINIGLLVAFKYFNFFNDTLKVIFHGMNVLDLIPPLSLILPVGISFYTFRNLSYLLDVYQGKIKAEKHLGLFAVYVAFWPLLLAGPIERASHLMPQLYSMVSLNYDRVVSGFRLMLWGYFKKVAIANQLAFYVNGVYAHPSQYGGNHYFLATLFFMMAIILFSYTEDYQFIYVQF